MTRLLRPLVAGTCAVLWPLVAAAQTPPRPAPTPGPDSLDSQISSPDVQALTDQTRQQMEQARGQADEARQRARLVLQDMEVFRLRSGDAYTTGLSSLQRRQYNQAITDFDRVVAQKNDHSDGALYWKAFAQLKLGRTSDSLATIAALRRDYPKSRYLGDAGVLEADVRRQAGQPVNPATINDDEIKLLAIQGLRTSEQAIPLLEGVLNATNSLAVKKRALYVLALSDAPRAHALLLRYAKGGGTPDLQIEAIRYLASRRDSKTAPADLQAIYASTNDTAVRRAVVDALTSPQGADALVELARKETNPDLERDIVQRLSGLAPHSPAASNYLMEVLRAK